MHAKPDLRVFLKMDDRWFRLGDHGRYRTNILVYYPYFSPVTPVDQCLVTIRLFTDDQLRAEDAEHPSICRIYLLRTIRRRVCLLARRHQSGQCCRDTIFPIDCYT